VRDLAATRYAFQPRIGARDPLRSRPNHGETNSSPPHLSGRLPAHKILRPLLGIGNRDFRSRTVYVAMAKKGFVSPEGATPQHARHRRPGPARTT